MIRPEVHCAPRVWRALPVLADGHQNPAPGIPDRRDGLPRTSPPLGPDTSDCQNPFFRNLLGYLPAGTGENMA